MDVRGVGLGDVLDGFSVYFDCSPGERRGDLQDCDLLGLSGIVAQRDFAARTESLLLRLEADFQIVLREDERLAVDRQRGRDQTTEETEDTEGLHVYFDAARRRWRTTSNNTIPAATDTFSDGTLPSIGMETRKSQCLRTRSCNPLPSAPSTTAQCIL